MGLDFGFAKVSKDLWISFNQDKDKFDEYFDNDNHTNEITYLNSWCGWGNPIERWFRDSLEYYDSYNGVLMYNIEPEDLYRVIQAGYCWFDSWIDPKPVVPGRAFKQDEDENLTLLKIDGIEVLDEDQAYHRFYTEEADGKLFITKHWIDRWGVYRFPAFVNEIMDLLLNFDWDNDVLLYYVSY